MQRQDSDITVQASREEWAALCFLAAQGISGVQPFVAEKKPDRESMPWNELTATAMRVVERAAVCE